jgi:hypothetical protein
MNIMIRIQGLLFLLGMVLMAPVEAQVTKKSENTVNLNSLRQEFVNPPVKYRMLQITHQAKTDGTLDSLKKYGYGGVVSNVGFNNYLQDEQEWKLLLAYMKQCRQLGMDFWLYDEKGYPSGKAGGLTLKDNPEYETVGLVCARTEGRGTITHPMPTGARYDKDPLFICAAPVKNGLYDFSSQVELTAEETGNRHVIVWRTPDKREWGILSFHIKRMYEGTHIVTNISDPNPYINIMDKAPVNKFIELTHEAYKYRAPEEMSEYIHAAFTDEPSLMTSYLKDEEGLLPAVPWSRSFREVFKKTKGYDIVPVLPYLFEDGGQATIYKRLDFWGMVSGLVEENYYGQLQNWCRANGPAASGHALLEESLYWQAVYEGNLFRDLRRMDLPGLDMLTSDPVALAHSTQIPVPKFVSSVTHMCQKWENMSETSSHYERTSNIPVSFNMRVATVGYEYALGLTRVTSYYGYNEFNDQERRTFNDYIGRLGLMLTQGNHAADVAVYYPIQSMWGSITPTHKTTWEPPDPMRTEKSNPQAVKNEGLYLTHHIISYGKDLPNAQRVDAAFGEVSRELLAGQADFDYIDDEALAGAEVSEGRIKMAGESFRCILFSETRIIPLASFQKIADFVKAGGKLVVLGTLPEMGMTESETKGVKQLSQQLRKSGSVKIVSGIPDIIQGVRTFIGQDLSLDKPCREIFYNHRSGEDTDLYFLINLSDQPVERNVTFRSTGTMELWDAFTGKILPVTEEIQIRNISTLKVHLEAFGSTIVVFKR